VAWRAFERLQAVAFKPSAVLRVYYLMNELLFDVLLWIVLQVGVRGHGLGLKAEGLGVKGLGVRG
jgi:hypothetical protein